jgi:hypothetical protein
MGTKATCTKCGKEKWVNTSKLKRIHDELGIRPSDWIKKKYICSECAERQALIRESDIESAIEGLREFGRSCKRIYGGILQSKSRSTELNDRIKSSMISSVENAGLSRDRIKFIVYKKLIIGMSLDIPIIGRTSIMFV